MRSSESPSVRSSAEHGAEVQRLRDLGQTAVLKGDLEHALVLFDRALTAAECTGSPKLVDLARCNRAAVAIELGRGEAEVAALQSVLQRNVDASSCLLAAYLLARFHELGGRLPKALFYARIAVDRSDALGRREQASSRNQVGNLLLAESRIGEATRRYEQALELIGTGTDVWRARVLDNLGYCRILETRYREGFALLFESLRILRSFKAERYEVSTRIDLCFAYLEVNRCRPAIRHGERALALARRTLQPAASKNALYLLGQASVMEGDADAARRWFEDLELEFYPDHRGVADLLLQVDVRRLVNLKA